MALTGLWLTGTEGALPSAGVTARLYFATDTSRIFLDTGAAWVRLNLIPRGAYAGGTTYYEKDLVTYNGSVWRALATVTGVTPVEGANWTLFVSKGDAGSGIASIDGVSNTGGDVDLVAGSNMTITPNDGANTITFAATSGGSAPFSDATALVMDNGDNTKLVRVEASSVATGTTRVITMPNADVDLGLQTPNTRTISTTAPLSGGGDLSANRTLSVGAASETATGVAEIATQAETDTGTDDARIVTPLKLRTSTATATRSGVVELATDAETTTGTDTTRATTPANVKAALDARLSTVRDWSFAGTLTTVTGALRVPIHQSGTITSIRAMVNTAPTGAAIIIDVNKNGTTMYTTQGNRPTIAISGNAVNATLPDITSLAAGDYLTVDLDQIGSTVAGANLVVSVRYSY